MVPAPIRFLFLQAIRHDSAKSHQRHRAITCYRISGAREIFSVLSGGSFDRAVIGSRDEDASRSSVLERLG